MQKIFANINRLSGGVATNTLAALMVRGFIIAARWAILFMIAKFTSPEIFGMVALAMTVSEITKVVADFGIDYFSIRQFAMLQSGQEIQKFAGSLLCVKAGYGLTLYTILFCYFLAGQQQQQSIIGMTTGLLIITSLLCSLPISYYQSKLAVIRLLPAVLTTNLLAAIAVAILLVRKLNILYAIAVLPAAEFLLASIMLHRLYRDVGIAFGPETRHEIVQLIKKAFPIGVTSICIVLYSRIDLVIIKHLTDLSAVGFYGFAFRVTEPFQFIAANYSISVYSHLAAELDKGKAFLKLLVNKYLFKSIGLGSVSFVMCLVLAHLLVKTVYVKYTPALPIINVLALLLVLKSINSTMTAQIHAYGQFRVITKLSFLNLIVIITTMYFMVKEYGGIGAAYALLAGESLNASAQYIILRKVSAVD